MLLKFEGGGQIFVFKISRENKKIEVASSKTNYKFEKKPWCHLFDKGKEAEQERITDKMDDTAFRAAIIVQMGQYGYKEEC